MPTATPNDEEPPSGTTSTRAAQRAQQRAAYTTSRPDICELVPLNAREILDVGCSNGEVGVTLMHRQLGCYVDGIELDEGLAKEARGRLREVKCLNVEHFDWSTGFGGRSYDCIIFADVLEHLADPARTLSAARERVVPHGCIVMSLPNIRHVSALWSIFVRGSFPQRPRGLFDRTHLRWFTLKDITRLLSDQGLTLERRVLSLRWGDQGGGRANRLLNRLPVPLQELAPIRELLTYQVTLRARI